MGPSLSCAKHRLPKASAVQLELGLPIDHNESVQFELFSDLVLKFRVGEGVELLGGLIELPAAPCRGLICSAR